VQSETSVTPSPPVSMPQTLSVDDHRPGVFTRGGWARLRVAREYGYLLRHLTGYAIRVFSNEGTDGVQAVDSEFGGVAVFRTIMTGSSS
jgi:hypothetical protein